MARKTRTTPTLASTEQAETTKAMVASFAEGVVATEQAPVAEATSEPTPKAKAEPKPLPTLDEALVTAKADPKTSERFAHVLRVTEQTKDGRPARVVVPCRNPQTKQGPDGERISVCEGEREIATQDLFQVVCCAACAERLVRIARRQRTKARIRSLREMAKANATQTA